MGPEYMECSIEDCKRPVIARGWCSLHYSRWHSHGDAHWKPERKGRKAKDVYVACSVEGCGTPATTRGFCHKHYNRWLRNDDPVLYIDVGKPVSKNIVMAARMKSLGMSYADIGTVLGVSRQRAQQYLSVPDSIGEKILDEQGGCLFCGNSKDKYEIHHVAYASADKTPVVLVCTSCHKKLDAIQGAWEKEHL